MSKRRSGTQGGTSVRRIAAMFSISPSAVSINTKKALNKIIRGVYDDTDCDMVTVCCAVAQHFEIDYEEVLHKLDRVNQTRLAHELRQQYGHAISNAPEDSFFKSVLCEG